MRKKGNGIGTSCQIKSLFEKTNNGFVPSEKYLNRVRRKYKPPELTIHTKFGIMTIKQICDKLGITKAQGYGKLKISGKAWPEIFDLPEYINIK